VIQLLLFAIAGLGLVYVSLLLVFWHFQERILFQPPSGVPPTSVPARQVHYRADDGVELFAYIVGECAPESTVVLAFHGNADLARWTVPWATRVASFTQACVVVPEYRGYDGLRGTPTYAGSVLDARAALSFVADTLHVQPRNTVYFGHSLGSAVAAELTTVQAPRALVLQSPFSSARAMSTRLPLPGLSAFWGLISRIHFDTIRRVTSLGVPVWVAHGDQDVVIPVHMGHEVFQAAAHQGELLIVPSAGHNDVPDVGGAAYWSWLARAVRGNDTTITSAPRTGSRLTP
jgi:pimeloyl-ACP methyl ester carboxylesterase